MTDLRQRSAAKLNGRTHVGTRGLLHSALRQANGCPRSAASFEERRLPGIARRSCGWAIRLSQRNAHRPHLLRWESGIVRTSRRHEADHKGTRAVRDEIADYMQISPDEQHGALSVIHTVSRTRRWPASPQRSAKARVPSAIVIAWRQRVSPIGQRSSESRRSCRQSPFGSS